MGYSKHLWLLAVAVCVIFLLCNLFVAMAVSHPFHKAMMERDEYAREYVTAIRYFLSACANEAFCSGNGECLVGRCFCKPGFQGDACKDISPYQVQSCHYSRPWSDMCFYTEEAGIALIDHYRWELAQKYERGWWINRGGSKWTTDHGPEMIKVFGGYKQLPMDLGNIVELGAGPFTQLVSILPLRDFYLESITLVEPMLHDYLEHPHNTYKDGKLLDYPVFLVESPAELLLEMQPTFAGHFDTLIMINVLEHVRSVYLVLDVIYELLRPGGVVVLFEPAFDDTHDFSVAEMLHPIRVKPAVLEYFFGEDRFERLFWKVDVSRRSPSSYYVIARKL